jgi:hypothetical protein
MANRSSADVGFLLVGGYSLLSSIVTELQGPDVEAVLEESHGLGEAWHASKPTGLRRGMLSQQGFFDDTAAAVNEAMSGNQQTARVLCYGPAGNVAGRLFTGMAGAFAGKYTRVASRGALHKANVEYTVSGQVDEGIILAPLTQRAGTGNTEGAESQDNGASSANGGVGYLQVTECTGVTNVVAKVRHSADDITYADLITFAAVTPWTPPATPPAAAAQRSTVAGTVNRHLAASWTFTGAGTITPMVGFSRG